MKWTPDRIEMLRNAYEGYGAKHAAEVMGCSIDNIEKHTRKFGIKLLPGVRSRLISEAMTGKRTSRSYDAAQLEAVKQRYAADGPYVLAVELNEMPRRIVTMARSLGVEWQCD